MDITPDTVALITGANGGIGMAIARALHRAGAKIIVTGRRADALEPIAKETGARVILADLARREDVERMHAEAGAVDVAVLNAALPGSGHLLEYDAAQIDKVFDVNLRAPVQSARHFGEGMAARRRGSIVFISSISGKVATAGQSLYNATKFGMRGFALALRGDLEPHGVGVSTIFPGFIRDAGMFADTKVALPSGAGTRTPEDVAVAVMRCVRRNHPELNVAAFEQVLGAGLFAVSPSIVSAITKASGGAKIAAAMSDAQKHKR
jgi:short-subunit dehydrogenase